MTKNKIIAGTVEPKVETDSPKEKFKKLIEIYKTKNPEKYAAKKEALEKQLAKL